MNSGPFIKGQLELGLLREKENDRNYHLGGRSFYFFDFDDNILFLATQILIFHKQSGAPLPLTSGEWALNHHAIGQHGAYKDYEIRFDDHTGSYQNFRDHEAEQLERRGLSRQPFVEDVASALLGTDAEWKGPSWECFYHASFNQRPVSLITARGHHPETIKEGIRELVARGILPLEPNYLSVFPVSHPEIRQHLGDEKGTLSIAELKQRAIRASVERAIEVYGDSPHHRFGMSDDDPKNIQLIRDEMTRLKSERPKMSFFIIETQHGSFTKKEIALESAASQSSTDQLEIFKKK